MGFQRKTPRWIRIIWTAALTLLLPLGSPGIYNLGPIYIAKITQLAYFFVGAPAVASGGYITNGAFTFGSSDGVFSTVTGVAVDSANDRMYVVDSVKVQKFVASTGAFVGAIGNSTASGTCVAGKQNSWCTGGVFSADTGDGMFAGSYGIAIDTINDRMYVVGSFRIQKFVLSTGAFVGAIGNSTASGTCVAGKQNSWCTGGVFSSGTGDGMIGSIVQAMAVDATNDSLYVADSQNSRIQKFVLSTGAFVGAIGKSAASGTCVAGKQNSWCTGGSFEANWGPSFDGLFNTPRGLAIDSANDFLYVSDAGTSLVQKFVASTGAFVGAIGYSSAAGTCVAGKQNSWCTGGSFGMSSIDGGFGAPYGVTIDTVNDRMFVVEVLYARVQKFVLSTGAYVGTIGGSGLNIGTCIQGKQNSWCTGGGGAFLMSSADGHFSGAMFLAADPVGNRLYVSDSSNSRIQKFNLSTGAFIGGLGGVASSTVQSPWTKVSQVGSAASSSLSGAFNSPASVRADPVNNHLYVLDAYRIQKLNLTTGVFIGAIGNSTASGTCVAGKQNSWCTGGVFSSGSGDGMFSSAGGGLAIDRAGGHLYLADYANNRIQKFVLSTGAFVGAIGNSTASGTCVAGKQNSWCTGGVFSSGVGDGMFNGPGSIAIDSDGDRFYVTDINNRRIQKFVLSTGAFVGAIGNSTASGTCAAGAQSAWCTGGSFSLGTGDGMFVYPRTLALDLTNDRLYVAENMRIQKFVLSTGAFVGAIGNSTASGTCVSGKQNSWCAGGSFNFGAGDGMFQSSLSVALDPIQNTLYISDGYHNRVQKFVLSTGAFVGAIGNSTASGTCAAGAQTTWCTGGTFSWGLLDGMFNALSDITLTNSYIYAVDNGRLQRITY